VAYIHITLSPYTRNINTQSENTPKRIDARNGVVYFARWKRAALHFTTAVKYGSERPFVNDFAIMYWSDAMNERLLLWIWV